MLVIMPHVETGQPTMAIEGAGSPVTEGIQALDGVFMAMRSRVARALRFDAETFDHFHLYDLDFSYRAFVSGLRLAVCRDLVVFHNSNGNCDHRWDAYRRRIERKFSGRLANVVNRRNAPIVNVPPDASILGDPAAVARLCRPETLARFVDRPGTAAPA